MSTRHECLDCGVDTFDIGEMYMVTDELWEHIVGQIVLVFDDDGVCTERTGPGLGMLCVGCFETRLGRELTPDDFSDAPINFPYAWGKSTRLIRRITGAEP